MSPLEQIPSIVEAIGPYEELPPLELERGLGPLRVGSLGIWPCGSDKAVPWAAISAVRVSVMPDEGGGMAALEARTGRRSLTTPLCIDLPGPAFEARAAEISDRLLRYNVDTGVERARWPSVDLTPRPSETPPPAEVAEVRMTEFEQECPHGIDPVLGRYIDARPSVGRLAWTAFFGLALACGGPLLWLLTVPGGIADWSAEQVVWMLLLVGVGDLLLGSAAWILLSWRSLRLGVNGFRVSPGCGSVLWWDAAAVELSEALVGMRLKVEVRPAGGHAAPAGGGRSRPVRRTFWLAPLAISGGKAGTVCLIVLAEKLWEASRASKSAG